MVSNKDACGRRRQCIVCSNCTVPDHLGADMLKAKFTILPFSLVVSSLMLKQTACCQEVAATYRTRTSGWSRVTAQCDCRKHGVFAYCNGFQLKWKYVSHTCFLKRALDNFTCSVCIDVPYQGRLVTSPNILRKVKYINKMFRYEIHTFVKSI